MVETTDQAIDLLIQAAQIAQKRGTFNLDEASLLSQAVNLLTAAKAAAVEESETKSKNQ